MDTGESLNHIYIGLQGIGDAPRLMSTFGGMTPAAKICKEGKSASTTLDGVSMGMKAEEEGSMCHDKQSTKWFCSIFDISTNLTEAALCWGRLLH